MTLQRRISWSTARSDIRNDRAAISNEQRRAHTASLGFEKIAASRARDAARVAPFVLAGRYDRKAIMSAAIAAAQARRSVTGDAWKVCLASALKGTWQVAKAARLARAH